MKKFMSVLLAGLMVSSVCYAEPSEDVLKILIPEEQVTSATGKTVVSFELNKPLGDFKADDYFEGIDFQYLLEEITGAKLYLDYEYDIKGDKKADFSATAAFDLPIHLNDSLKIDAWAKFDFWGKFDLEEIKNAKFELISKNPLENGLTVMDVIGEHFAGNPNFLADIDFSAMEEISGEVTKKLCEYAEVRKTEEGYTLKISNDKFEKVAIEALKATGEIIETPYTDDYVENLDEFFEEFDVLGSDGLNITLITDEENKLRESSVNAHVTFNIYDIMVFCQGDTEGFTKENSDLDFDVNIKTEHSGVNSTVIEFPDTADALVSDAYPVGYSFTVKEKALLKDNAVYYPIEAIAEKCGYTVEYDGKFLNASYNADDKGVVSTEFESWHFVKENDKLYCTPTVLDAINVSSDGGIYNFNTKEFNFTYRYYPDYKEIIREAYEDYEEEIPYSMYFEFTKDGYPYIKDNTIYIPVTDFLESGFVGDFNVTENTLDFLATEKNALEIEGFGLCNGDDKVFINGEAIPIDANILKHEGELYIPASFFDKYGIYCNLTTNYDGSGNARTRYWGNYQRVYDDYTYEPEAFYYYAMSDLLPYRTENEVYIPVRYLLDELAGGVITPLDGGFEFKASKRNDLEIKSVKGFVGDNFLYINDEKISFEGNIINESDRIQVPLSFLKAYGFENINVEINGDYGVTYSFRMDNPDYKEGEY